jgi:Family of unknown function (DUF6328)
MNAKTPKQQAGKELPLDKAATLVLHESRMVLPGIQALFGFLLIVVFSDTFTKIGCFRAAAPPSGHHSGGDCHDDHPDPGSISSPDRGKGSSERIRSDCFKIVIAQHVSPSDQHLH